MFKTITKKRYLPDFNDWEDKYDFPRKEPVLFHRLCKKFDSSCSKCTRRNVIVEADEIACQCIETKFTSVDQKDL